MAEINFGAGVAERDIDLLLLEEFYSSNNFRLWFLKKIGISNGEELGFLCANHSINDDNGESDLIIKFKDKNDGEIWLLIEDKINAKFQPKQIERYNERAANYISQKKCILATSVLVAPEKYTQNLKSDPQNISNFRAIVTFQQINDHLYSDLSDSNESRRKFKIALLEKAIAQKIYVPVEIIPVQQFWNSYQIMASEQYPDLNLEAIPPSGKDNFWAFRPNSITKIKGPNKVELIHKLYVISRHGGFVDIQFRGLGDKLHILETIFRQVLEPGMEIVKVHKSGAISQKVPDLQNTLSFESQKDNVIIGLNAVARMAEWFSKYSYLWNDYWATHS